MTVCSIPVTYLSLWSSKNPHPGMTLLLLREEKKKFHHCLILSSCHKHSPAPQLGIKEATKLFSITSYKIKKNDIPDTIAHLNTYVRTHIHTHRHIPPGAKINIKPIKLIGIPSRYLSSPVLLREYLPLSSVVLDRWDEKPMCSRQSVKSVNWRTRVCLSNCVWFKEALLESP